MTLSEYKIDYRREIEEEFLQEHFNCYNIPNWFIEMEYLKHTKKYDLTSWMRYLFNQFREEKTGLKFNSLK